MKPKAWSNRLTTKHNTMWWQRSTTVWQRNTMRWGLSPTGWQRNTTHWQRSTTDWKCVSMRWQRTTTHLQCIDNGLQRIFKAQRVFVDFPYAGFSQIGSHLSILSRNIGFLWSQTRRNASRSTIAEANLDVTWSIFVHSRERSTTYRVKRFSDVAFFPCGAVTTNCRFIKIPWNTYEKPMNLFSGPWILHFPFSWPHWNPLIFHENYFMAHENFFQGHEKLVMTQKWN